MKPPRPIFTSPLNFTVYHSEDSCIDTLKSIDSTWHITNVQTRVIALDDDLFAVRIGGRVLIGWAVLTFTADDGVVTHIEGKIGVSARILLLLMLPFIFTAAVFVEGTHPNSAIASVILLAIMLLFLSGMMYAAVSAMKEQLESILSGLFKE